MTFRLSSVNVSVAAVGCARTRTGETASCRSVPDVVGPVPMLKYAPFAAVPGMAVIDKGGASLLKGKRGAAVAMLQGALLDLGAKMPKTSALQGSPDGIFGEETLKAVQDLQTKHKLKADGIVGKKTLALLDGLMVGKNAKIAPPTPKLAPPRPPPRDVDYQLGEADPPIVSDTGSGPWNSKPKRAVYYALRYQIINILPHAHLVIGDDAAKHMAHYLLNSGQPYRVDLEDMLREVPSALDNLAAEVAQAQGFSESLPEGRHKITSRTAEGGYNGKDENWNWYFATGGYVSWGKGEVVVRNTPTVREYDMDFEYKFFDRYNWDKEKSVKIVDFEITDEFMGEFHRQGLAREFDCVGSVRRRLTWTHGQDIMPAQLRSVGGRA